MERRNNESTTGDGDDGLKVGSFVIGDQGVRWNSEDQDESQEEDTLVGDQGVRMKDVRALLA